MKKLLFIPLILIAAWSLYWMVGKNALTGALTQAQTDLREDGIELSTDDIKVKGFPLRYNASLSNVNITADTGSYEAELINIKASAMKPTVWTLTADTPARVKFTGKNGQDYDFILAGEEMRIETGSSVTGKLKAVSVTMRGIKALAAPDGTAPPIVGIDAGEILISPSTAPLQDGMSARFDIQGITLANKAGGNLQRAFGPTITRIDGTGLATGLVSLEGGDIDAWQTGGSVTVPDFALDWGKVSFLGEVDLDMGRAVKAGQTGGTGQTGANGAATLGVSDADALIQSFVDAGMLTQTQALAGSFLLMAAPTDEQGRIVLTFPVEDNALTLFGQTLHTF